MPSLKDKIKKIKGSHLLIAGALLLIVLAVSLLWFNDSDSVQAESAMVADVYFAGEYRIADGEWQPIEEGKHIPSTQGDVTLRGNFHIIAPDGEYVGIYRGDMPIAFYSDHIALSFREGDGELYTIDAENPLYGDSACGTTWTAHSFTSECEYIIEIIVHNPHSFGNETAIDEMLSKIAFWSGIEFEKGILDSGSTERNVGLFFVMVSVMLLGIALFSSLIHIKNSKIIWILGSLSLFAGIYFAFNADGVAFWNESIVSNTTILGASMMLYMFFLSILTVCLMGVMRKIGRLAVILLGVANAVFFLVPIASDVLFYDLWIWWSVASS